MSILVPDVIGVDGAANVAITDAGYTVTPTSGGACYARAVHGQTTGKFYFEVKLAKKAGLSTGSGVGIGPAVITPINVALSSGPATGGYTVNFTSSHRKWYNGSLQNVDDADGPGYYNTKNSPLNTFMGVAVDLDAGLYWIAPAVDSATTAGVLFSPTDRSPANCVNADPGVCCFTLVKNSGIMFNSDASSTSPMVEETPDHVSCVSVDRTGAGVPGAGRGLPLGGSPGDIWYPTLLAANGTTYVDHFEVNFGQKPFTGFVPNGFMSGWPASFTPDPPTDVWAALYWDKQRAWPPFT